MNPVYDRLINAPAGPSAQATMLLIDRLQDFAEDRQGVAIVASAALFLLLCERFKVEPQDAFVATKNLMAETTRRGAQVQLAALSISTIGPGKAAGPAHYP